MTGRRLGYLTGFAVLASSGVYVFVYLYRWEWNRALFASAMFLAAEVALLGVAALERIGRLERRIGNDDPQVLRRIKETAPEPHRPFAWLDPRQQRLGVFVPILMGAGIVASGLAWIVERVARATAGPALERGLAGQLAPMGWPEGGLLPPPDGAITLLAGPGVAGR